MGEIKEQRSRYQAKIEAIEHILMDHSLNKCTYSENKYVADTILGHASTLFSPTEMEVITAVFLTALL